jgi:hypothetical protein
MEECENDISYEELKSSVELWAEVIYKTSFLEICQIIMFIRSLKQTPLFNIYQSYTSF